MFGGCFGCLVGPIIILFITNIRARASVHKGTQAAHEGGRRYAYIVPPLHFVDGRMGGYQTVEIHIGALPDGVGL